MQGYGMELLSNLIKRPSSYIHYCAICRLVETKWVVYQSLIEACAVKRVSEEFDAQNQELNEKLKYQVIAQVREQSEQIEKLEIANDPFVWKVPHFHTLIGKAKTGVKQVLLSESFSLWKNGYMLRIKMMLEKFSEWGSVFLSLSIVNVPGEFDKSLSWPFVEKIHVAIIDQNPCKEESDNMSHVIDFGHKRDRATFKALTITGDCEFGTMFASANELYIRSYIVNDAVLITASTEEDKVQPS